MLAAVKVPTSGLRSNTVKIEALLYNPEEKRFPNPMPMPKVSPRFSASFEKDKTYQCILQLKGIPPFRMLVDRAYLDYIYPDKKIRTEAKIFVTDFTEKVILGFQVNR